MVQSDLPFRLFFYGCEKFMGQMPGVDSIKRTYGDIASETYLINLINAPKEIHFFIGFKHIRIQNFDFLDNCYSFFFSIFLHRSRLDARFILPVFQFIRLQVFFRVVFTPKYIYLENMESKPNKILYQHSKLETFFKKVYRHFSVVVLWLFLRLSFFVALFPFSS